VKRQIKKLPSVLEITSYTFFFPGCIAGPFFEYSDYIRFIEETDEFANIPFTLLESLKRFGQGKSN
jgi:lysophospholipid acyltransferase